ncbi:hypothetical protein J6A32_09655 [Methanocorpusculum sp.]|nr:hypothetical protein [Methanocorpusculum sp.]
MTTHQKQEEGRRTTTKSERTSASSLTNATAEHKKIIDAEEQQDSERLTVDCRVSADAGILHLISTAKIQNEIGMLMETTAKAARSILLRAADRIGCSTEPFGTSCMEIHLRFSEPETLFQICSREEEDGEN